MAGEEYLICYLFYQLDALGEWNLCLIAVIAHFIIILQPLVSIKLRLKIPSGNVNHSHILAHNNDIQSNMSVMIVSMPLLEVITLAPASVNCTKLLILSYHLSSPGSLSWNRLEELQEFTQT